MYNCTHFSAAWYVVKVVCWAVGLWNCVPASAARVMVEQDFNNIARSMCFSVNEEYRAWHAGWDG